MPKIIGRLAVLRNWLSELLSDDRRVGVGAPNSVTLEVVVVAVFVLVVAADSFGSMGRALLALTTALFVSAAGVTAAVLSTGAGVFATLKAT